MTVTAVVWGTKIKPGKVDAWRNFNAQVEGARAEEARDQRRRMGFRRHVVCLQKLADDFVVLNFAETEDLKAGFRHLAESEVPFDLWFKTQAFEVYGVTPEMMAQAPSSEIVSDWAVESAKR